MNTRPPLEITLSTGSGKACNGCARTKTLRLIRHMGSGFMILKQFRFTNGDDKSLRRAYAKAHAAMKAEEAKALA